MQLRGMVVCVNYADLFARSIDRWRDGLDSLCVITSSTDKQTQKLCKAHGVDTHVTDVFYANGASFNKGAALVEAVKAKDFTGPAADWCLFFDADIVPLPDWRMDMDSYTLSPDTLYGARRCYVPEQGELVYNRKAMMPQGWVIGFFTLFHATDPVLKSVNGHLFDIDWPHAGNYDTVFTRRWPKAKQVILPLPLMHLGEERTHWHGRNEKQKMAATLKARGGTFSERWEHERMTNPPKV